jgi:uncharacterized delta-60 repeat protein
VKLLVLRFLACLFLVLGLALSQNTVLDPTFNGNGTALLTSIVASSQPSAIVDARGRIVLSGMTNYSPLTTEFTIARLQSNGQFDPSFGRDGVMQPSHSGVVFVDNHDRVLIVQSHRILRFTIQGNLDKRYGRNGVFLFPTGTKTTRYFKGHVAMLPDGGFWVGLYLVPRTPPTDPSDEVNEEVRLIRVNSQGKLDSSLGKQGLISIPVRHSNLHMDGLVVTRTGGVVGVFSGDLNNRMILFYDRPNWLFRIDAQGKLTSLESLNELQVFCPLSGYLIDLDVRTDDTVFIRNSNNGDCYHADSLWLLDNANRPINTFGDRLPTIEGEFPPGQDGPVLSRNQKGRIWLLKRDQELDPSKLVVWRDNSILLYGASFESIRFQKLDSNGNPDMSFSGGNVVEVPNPFHPERFSVLEAANHKILLVGIEKSVWVVKRLNMW